MDTTSSVMNVLGRPIFRSKMHWTSKFTFKCVLDLGCYGCSDKSSLHLDFSIAADLEHVLKNDFNFPVVPRSLANTKRRRTPDHFGPARMKSKFIQNFHNNVSGHSRKVVDYKQIHLLSHLPNATCLPSIAKYMSLTSKIP